MINTFEINKDKINSAIDLFDKNKDKINNIVSKIDEQKITNLINKANKISDSIDDKSIETAKKTILICLLVFIISILGKKQSKNA